MTVPFSPCRAVRAEVQTTGLIPPSRLRPPPPSHTLLQTIARAVFEVIVDQSPLVPEEPVEEQEAPVADGSFLEEGTSERDVTWKTPLSKKKTGERIPSNRLPLFGWSPRPTFQNAF